MKWLLLMTEIRSLKLKHCLKYSKKATFFCHVLARRPSTNYCRLVYSIHTKGLYTQ